MILLQFISFYLFSYKTRIYNCIDKNHRRRSKQHLPSSLNLKMRDLPSCFSENGVQVADFSSNTSKSAQNSVSSIYRCHLQGHSCLITITWSKNLMGQVLNVGIEDSSNNSLCKVDIKPSLFSKRRGSKSLEVNSSKIHVFWDLSSAKFGPRPEPSEGFYLAIVADQQILLLLGDMRKEAFKKTNAIPLPSSAIFIAKREHVFGKKVFGTKGQFCSNGQIHDLVIECDTFSLKEPSLVIRIDSKMVMQVKRLHWKFRGNHTILVDGLDIEVFWDVHNWLFSSSTGHAVFMFKTSPSSDKMTLNHPTLLPFSFSQRLVDMKSQNLGFSLILYAWKND